MDHRGPHNHHHQHHSHHHHQQQQQFQPMMVQNPSYPTTNTNLPLPSNPTPIFQTHFPFNPTYPTPGYTHDGSGSGSGSGEFGIDTHTKKKRGRPRKFSPPNNDGSSGGGFALGLSPASGHGGSHHDGGEGSCGAGGDGSEQRKLRGRPPGSGKKQLDALGNCGVGFTPHVILVNTGEDIASKIVAFAKDGPRTVCIMSANGSICKASLRQPGNSGGIVNYEGRYEIISLLGSFLFSEDSGNVRTNGLSISMAGSDGRVLGGGVAGMLLAASPVQIIVGTFIADGKKLKSMPIPNSHMLTFSSPPDAGSPSQGASSEESEENASNHIDRNMGSYSNNSNPQMHHHNMQMYTHMGWSNSGSKMPSHHM